MSRGGVRLATGQHRGRLLPVAPGVRPTEGRVRAALLSIWQQRLEGARFLELFAGSGAMALEVAGRGARRVVCVERDRRCLDALAAACRACGEERVELQCRELPAGLATLHGPFDLVFADPPYAFDAYAQLLAALAPLLDAASEVAVEHAARTVLPEHTGSLERCDQRRYGDTLLSFYRLAEACPGPSATSS